MTNLMIRLLLGLILLVAIEPAPCHAQDGESSIEELIGFSKSPDDVTRRDALYHLVLRGVKEGETEDGVIEVLARCCDDDDRQVRFQALLGLARAGNSALPAMPELFTAIRSSDDQVRFRATDAIAKIGPEGLSALYEFWPKARTSTKISFAQAMGQMGSAAQPNFLQIAELFAKEESPSEDLQYAMADCLSSIAPQDEQLLLSLFQHADGRIREIGIRRLARVKDLSAPAQQALVTSAEDPDAAVRELGTIAVANSAVDRSTKARVLLSALRDDSVGVRSAALTGLRKARSIDPQFTLPLNDLLDRLAGDGQTPGESRAVLRAFLIVGFDLEQDLPKLLSLAATQELDNSLFSKLVARGGPETIPILLDELAKNAKLQELTLFCLLENASLNSQAIQVGLGHESQRVQAVCAQAVTQIRPIEQNTIDGLLTLFTEDEAVLRSAVLQAFGRILDAKQTLSPETVRQLTFAAQDQHPNVRIAFFEILDRLPIDQEERQALFTAGLQDKETDVQVASLTVLSNSASSLEAIKSEVMEKGRAESAEVRVAAMTTIAELSAEDEAVTAVLLQGLQDDSNQVRLAATNSLSILGLGATELREDVLRSLGENLIDDVDLLRSTLTALRQAGADASPTAASVAHLLEHPREDIRVSAVKTLREVSTEENELVQLLISGLEDEQWTVRQAAAEALGSLGEAAKAAVPALYAKLGNEEDEDFARGAIRDIDAAPAEMVSTLMDNLDSEDRRRQFYAVFLLGRIGPDAADALPELKDRLANSGSSRGRSFLKRYLEEAIESIEADEGE